MKSTESILDFYALTKELRIFAEGNGYTVNFKADGDTSPPSADNQGRISVAKPNVSWTNEQVLEWKATFYHEIGHQVPEMRDIFTLMEDKNIDLSKQTLFGGILNCLDDIRQEKHNLGRYPGRDVTLSKGNASYLKANNLPKFQALNGDWSQVDKLPQQMSVMLTGSIDARSSWQPACLGLNNDFYGTLSQEMKDQHDKLMTFEDQIDEMETAEDVYNLTKTLIREVFEEDDDEEEEKSKGDDGDSSGEGEGEKGQGKGKGEDGGGNKHGDAYSGQAEDREGEGDKGGHPSKIKYEDLLKHDHSKNADGASYQPLEITYKDSDYTGSTFKPDVNPEVHDYTKGTGVGNNTNYGDRANSLNVSTGLSNRIRKLLQVKAQTITLHSQKKGKLATRNLYRATMKDSGSYQNKVFKKKITNNILDVSVTVLADFSGSMGGEKQEHSIASALMLNDSLAKIGVPMELLGFTERNNSCMYVFKTHKKSVSRQTLADDMGRASSFCMGCNADGEAIVWSYDRLRRQPTQRKILIVLSDGQPASHRGPIAAYTKDVIQAIENKKDVEIYGIGIMSNSVEKLYKHNRVIQSADDLEGALLNVIKEYIIN